MTRQQVEDLLEGVAELECLGNLYEYIGIDENGKLLFQDINNDHYIKTSCDNLLTMPEYEYYPL
jgi:hypothetical protein